MKKFLFVILICLSTFSFAREYSDELWKIKIGETIELETHFIDITYICDECKIPVWHFGFLEAWQFSVQIKDQSFLAYTNEDDETWYFSAELLEYKKNEFAKLKTNKGKIITIEKVK